MMNAVGFRSPIPAQRPLAGPVQFAAAASKADKAAVKALGDQIPELLEQYETEIKHPTLNKAVKLFFKEWGLAYTHLIEEAKASPKLEVSLFGTATDPLDKLENFCTAKMVGLLKVFIQQQVLSPQTDAVLEASARDYAQNLNTTF